MASFIANLSLSEAERAALVTQRMYGGAGGLRLDSPNSIVAWLTAISSQLQAQAALRNSTGGGGGGGGGAVHHGQALHPAMQSLSQAANIGKGKGKRTGACKLCKAPDHWAAECPTRDKSKDA